MVKNLKFIWIVFLFAQLAVAQDISVTEKDSTKVHNIEKAKIDTQKNGIPKYQHNLKEEYNSENFNYGIETKEAIGNTLWERFKNWIASVLRSIFSGLDPTATSNGITIFFRILFIAIIIFAIYMIAKLLLKKEGQWIFAKSSKKVIRHEDIEKNLEAVDFENLIQNTIKQGNKRLAIRYYYLWLLKKLSQKSYINWHPEKTNSDYYYEIQNASVKNKFDYASYLYTYIWYGEFEVTDTIFSEAKNTFDTTISSI